MGSSPAERTISAAWSGWTNLDRLPARADGPDGACVRLSLRRGRVSRAQGTAEGSREYAGCGMPHDSRPPTHAAEVWADGLAARVKALPEKPGVYLFRNERGDVIYVGKAASLRSRGALLLRGAAIVAGQDATVVGGRSRTSST